MEEEKAPLGRRIQRFIVWVVLVVIGFWLLGEINDVFTEQLLYGDGKEGAYIMLAVITVFVLAIMSILYLYDRLGENAWIPFLVFLGIFVAFELYDINEDQKKLDDGVYDYCAYDATEGQLFACLEETTPGVVRYSESAAGRFARDEQGCGADAGPLCKQAEEDQEFREEYEDFKEGGP